MTNAYADDIVSTFIPSEEELDYSLDEKTVLQAVYEAVYEDVLQENIQLMQFNQMELVSENFALNKPVTYSGVEGGRSGDNWKYPDFVGESAVDGNVNTRWSADRLDNQWLIVDLQEIKNINLIVIRFHATSPDYEVQVSTDGENYVTVFKVTDGPHGTAGRGTKEIRFDDTLARYVKFQQYQQFTHTNGQKYSASIYELEVYYEDVINRIAKDITDIPEIQKGQTKINFPEVPEKYGISIYHCDRPQVIDEDGRIHTPLNDVVVNLSLKVYCKDDPEAYATTNMISVTVPGQYDPDESVNEEPKVIPSLREWHGRAGYFTLSKNSRIVVPLKYKNELQKTAEIAKTYIKDICDYDLEITYGSPAPGDIFLTLDDSIAHLGEEGYILDINDYVSISSSNKKGVFYGAITILQILKQDEAHINIPKGITRDYPKYEVRGLMLDVGRKFYTIDFLRDYVKLLAWYKMNVFHIHLNDVPGGFRLESETYPGLAADQYYTKQEFRDLVYLGMDYGVNIIPEIDTPGHSKAFTDYDPSLGSGSYLDVSKPETLEFVKKLFDEYLDPDNPTFIGPDVHIGTDEYATNSQEEVELFRAYTDQLIKYINSKGKRPHLWGGLKQYAGQTPISNEATMDYWSSTYSGNPGEALELGYDVVNVGGTYLYIVPRRGIYRDYLDIKWLYENWDPTVWTSTETIPFHPGLKGAKFALWNDRSVSLGVTMHDSHDRMFPAIQVVSEKTWREPRKDRSYDDFASYAAKIGEAPTLNISHKLEVENENGNVIKYTFEEGLKDSSGNGYDATGYNVAESKGRFGKGIRLNGGASYIETPLRSLGFGWTVSMWVKPDADNPDDAVLMESPEGQLKLKQGTSGKIGISKEDYDDYFNYTVPADAWTHIMLTGDNKSTTLIVNGGEYVEKLENCTFILPMAKIGSETNAFKGVIDNVIVYNLVTDLLGVNDNLALGKAAQASSSITNDLTPDKAVDGDTATRWSSDYTANEWFVVDLGKLTQINTVKIIWERAYATKYKILVSEDNETWTNVLDNDGIISGSGGTEIVEFEPIKARYVKFQGIERTAVSGKLYGYSFYEFEVYRPAQTLPSEYTEAIAEAERLLALNQGDQEIREELQNMLNDFPYNYEKSTPVLLELIDKLQKSITRIISIEPIEIVTQVGKAPELPTVVTAVYSDGSTAELGVVWEEIDPAQYQEPGTFTVEGIVEGTNLKAIATINVKLIVEEKPFTIIKVGNLDRTTGIKATVRVKQTPDAKHHQGNEVVLFQLMKGTTPINIVALEKDITTEEVLTAHFNVEDCKDVSYTVKVFVFDRFDSDINAPENLAEPLKLQ